MGGYLFEALYYPNKQGNREKRYINIDYWNKDIKRSLCVVAGGFLQKYRKDR